MSRRLMPAPPPDGVSLKAIPFGRMTAYTIVAGELPVVT